MAGNNALAKLYSWADGVKRRARNPMQTLALGLTQASEDLQQAATDADIAYGRNGMKSVLLSQQQKDEAAKRAAQFGEQMAMAAATVWHGSPHKFDKFDSSKIGTGEGAQAYGHGLYLAEAPSVAQKYADDLSSWSISTRDGVKNGGDFADHLVANAGDYPPSLSSAIRSQADKIATDLSAGKPAEQIVASIRNGPYKRMYGGLADAVEKLAPTKAGGNLYKVDLPDNAIAKMLDWDKPLSQQAPEVRAALKNAPTMRLRDGMAIPGGGKLKVVQDEDFGTKYFIDYGDQKFKITEPEVRNLLGGGTEGKSLFSELINTYGPKKAEDWLRAKGIPGIRYLDGGSRGAGGGTSNYVVFPGNENLLRILERNGRALP